jgi:hypothetical protein
MSLTKLLLLQKLELPMEVIEIIKEYLLLPLIQYKAKKIKNSILKKFILDHYTLDSTLDTLGTLDTQWLRWVFEAKWKRDWIQMQGNMCKLCGEYDLTCHNIKRYCVCLL